MQLPLQITFRHMDTSDAVAARIRERVEELERFSDRIMSCRVVVECQHPRRQQGNLFRVRVDLKIPGREIAVGRDPAAHHAHEDVIRGPGRFRRRPPAARRPRSPGSGAGQAARGAGSRAGRANSSPSKTAASS